jgi:hypothetical protein
MRPDYDPDPLSPHDRLCEVARLLAAGVLRLLDRPAQAASVEAQSAPENLDDVPRDCLEVPGETVLSVQDG